jgi:hypothetical protein
MGTIREIGRVALALVAVSMVALLFACVMLVVGRTASVAPSPLDSVLMIITVVLNLALTAILFLAIPQGVALRWLGVSHWAAYLAAGFAAGWTLLFVSLFESQLNDLVARQPAAEAPGIAIRLLVTGLPRLAGALYAGNSVGPLLLFGGIGAALCVFGWRNAFPRLQGDEGRDWEGRVLGQRPPYSQ